MQKHKKFKKIFVETTNICNLNCSFCPKTKREAKMLTPKEFEYIIEKIKDYTDYIYLHVMGEPLLNNNIGTFLAINEKFGLKTVITTNGILIKDKQDILLNSKSLHMLSFSLHSFEANNSGIPLEEYIGNIVDFAISAAEKNIISSLRLWNLDGKDTIGDNSFNDIILNIIEEKLGLDFKIKEKIGNKSNLTLRKYIYFERSEKFIWPEIKGEERNENGFCYGLRNHIGILSNGNVIPCCLDHEGDITLGNIFNESLEDILSSQRAMNIYNGFTGRNPVEKLCKSCGFIQKF